LIIAFSSSFFEIFPIYLHFDFSLAFFFPVRQMHLALMRECEGSLRGYVGGSDTGDRLTIDYTDMSFLCYHGSVQRNTGMW